MSLKPQQPPKKPRVANVIPFRPSKVKPSTPNHLAHHPERIAAVQAYFLRQSGQSETVAAVTISVTSTGMLVTEGVAIEPEHALAMLLALPTLRTRLENTVASGNFAQALARR
jgi:hypothetical protein